MKEWNGKIILKINYLNNIFLKKKKKNQKKKLLLEIMKF